MFDRGLRLRRCDLQKSVHAARLDGVRVHAGWKRPDHKHAVALVARVLARCLHHLALTVDLDVDVTSIHPRHPIIQDGTQLSSSTSMCSLLTKTSIGPCSPFRNSKRKLR